MADERVDWEVLGRKIGTATGWDQSDTFIMMLYDFEPAMGINLPAGTLCINFESGKAETYDDAGEVVESKDIVAALAALQPA